MASIISNIKNAKDGSIKERIKSEFPDFNCVSEGYTQVFNGVEEGMKKSLSDFCRVLKTVYSYFVSLIYVFYFLS